jgi:hypothetical protein
MLKSVHQAPDQSIVVETCPQIAAEGGLEGLWVIRVLDVTAIRRCWDGLLD